MEAKSSKSSFWRAYWRWTKPPKKDWKTDGSESISIFSSRVWTNIFWCTVLEITATQSTDFVTAKNMKSIEVECGRVGLHKCFASHRIKYETRYYFILIIYFVNRLHGTSYNSVWINGWLKWRKISMPFDWLTSTIIVYYVFCL